jgi:hypothetical protein
MCIICTEWEKGKMTSTEALRAAGEMMGDKASVEHVREVVNKIMEKESPSGSDQDVEIDEEWERKNRGGD